MALLSVAKTAAATPQPLPPGLERSIPGLIGEDPLPGGCVIPGTRIESYAVQIRIQCGSDSGVLRLVLKDAANEDEAILTSRSFSIEVAPQSPSSVKEAARQVASRVAARDDGQFLDKAGTLRALIAKTEGDAASIVQARPLGPLDSVRRAALWAVLLFLLVRMSAAFVRGGFAVRKDLLWVGALFTLLATALAVRFIVPPWGPLHANGHGIAELRGLASPTRLWRIPAETNRYGPAYREIVLAAMSPWRGGAQSALGFSAVASAACVIPLALLTAALIGSRLAGLVAALGLAAHPIHIALAGTESAMPLAGLLFLVGLAAVAGVPQTQSPVDRRSLYWIGSLALAAAAELGVTTLAFPVAALLIGVAVLRRSDAREWRLWLPPLLVLAACLLLHLYAVTPILHDARVTRGRDIIASLRAFRGSRDALFDSTLTARTLVPLAVFGMGVLLLRRPALAVTLALGSGLLLAAGATVNACRSDAIRYQADAHLLLFVAASATLLLFPARPVWRAAGAFALAAVLVLPARGTGSIGWKSIRAPLIEQAAYHLIERAAPGLPASVMIHLPRRRMSDNQVITDFPEFVLRRRGRTIDTDESVPDQAAPGCLVWLGPSCYSFTDADVDRHLPEKAVKVGDAPLRKECEDLVSHIDDSPSGVIAADMLPVPYRESEFHHVPPYMLVGLFSCKGAVTAGK